MSQINNNWKVRKMREMIEQIHGYKMTCELSVKEVKKII